MNALDIIYFRKTTKPSTGGASAGDLFALTGAPAFGTEAANTITNFNPKEKDKLQIDPSTFDGAVGKLNIAKKTKQVAKLANKDIDFIYDQQAGYLYCNENGKQPDRTGTRCCTSRSRLVRGAWGPRLGITWAEGVGW